MTTLFFIEHANGKISDQSLKAISATKDFGEDVHGLIAGTDIDSIIEEASKISGVSKIIHVDNDEYNNILAEKLTSIIVDISDNYNYFCAAATTTGKNVMPRVAAKLDVAQISEIIGVESNENNRRDYREILFQTKNAMENYISGVILFDETIRQKSKKGPTLVEVISNAGSLPGIKVDTGAKDLAFNSNEKVTEGLDGLRERLIEYYNLGAKFAKWRAVITPGDSIPTDDCILANAKNLAKYAKKCQEANLVPIVEPEVLMDGSHTIDESFDITSRTLNMVFDQLDEHNVSLQGIVLKPNMILSGYECSYQASIEEVAEKTVNCLSAHVPSEVPGIAFLSGGQSDEDATLHLNEMSKYETDWNLTFSYGRALQQSALKAWSGKKENVTDAQEAFIEKAKANSLATVAGL